MYYMLTVMTVDEDYEGVINVALLSADLKKRLVDSVEYGLKNGHNYGEILDANNDEIEEIFEQDFSSPINFPYHIDAIVEISSKDR